MKRFLMLCIGLSLFTISIDSASAGLNCIEGDRLCECQKAWSVAFDAATDYVIDEELSQYLAQEKVSPTDITAGFRTLSMRNSCYLRVVCNTAVTGGNLQAANKPYSPNNSVGGGMPGKFAACAGGSTPLEMFQKFENGAQIFADVQRACSMFVNPLTDAAAAAVETGPSRTFELSLNQRIMMADRCESHVEVSTAIFDRMVRNMIRKDSTKRVIGYMSQKIFSMMARLQELQQKAQGFAVNTNASMNLLCTLSDPD
jgi:hypothetical protein